VSSEAAAQLIERTDRTLQDMEDAEVERLYAALDASYRRLEADLLRRYPNYTAESKPDLLATQRGVLLVNDLQAQLALIDPDREQELRDRYEKLLSTASKEGTTLGDELVALEQGDSFVKATATVPIEAAAFAARDAVDRLKKHDQTFREEASVIITQGLIQGQGAQKVAGFLRQRLGVTKGKAETIARTEIISAQDSATRSRYKEYGIQYVQRIATQDRRVCKFCADRAGNVYPVDSAPAVIHPRDRCFNTIFLPEQEASDPKANEWVKQHAEKVKATTTDQSTGNVAPFERAANISPPKPVWTPADGYLDRSVQVKGEQWAVGKLAAQLLTDRSRRQTPQEQVNNDLLIALTVGAAVVGTSVGSYYLARSRYRKGFKRSATMAQELSQKFRKGVEADPSENDEQITFVVGGFSGEQGGQGIYLANYFQKVVLPKHRVVGVRTPEFDVEDPGGAPTPRKVSQIFSKFLSTAIVEGRNMASVRVAAQAYAFHQKYPDKPINIIGYSAGGATAFEAAEILKEMGITAKVVAIGSPYFGFNEISPEQGITIAGTGDPWAQLSALNRVPLANVKNHSLEQYLPDEEFVATIKEFLRADIPRKERSSEATEPVKTEQTIDDDVLARQIDELIPQLLLLSADEIRLLPPAIAQKVLAARNAAGLLPGRADPKALPGLAEPKALPGYEPLLALPEAQPVKGLLRGELPRLALPAGLELAPLTPVERQALETKIARNLYKQARSIDRGASRLAEFRLRQAIDEIKRQDMPAQVKGAAYRKAVFEQLQGTIESAEATPPGAKDAEQFDRFRFKGVDWYVPKLGENSPTLDLLRKVAELDLPENALGSGDIYITRQRNASEQYWRKKLKLNTPKVNGMVAFDEGAIALYGGRAKIDDLLLQAGYLRAYQQFGQLTPPERSEYARAMSETRMAYQSRPDRDFAESVKEFFLNPDYLKKFAPARYEAIARIFDYRHPRKGVLQPQSAEPQQPDTRSPQIVEDLRTANATLADRIRTQREQANELATAQRSTKKIQQALDRVDLPRTAVQQEQASQEIRIQEEAINRVEAQIEAIEQRAAQLLNPLNPPYFSTVPQQIRAARAQLKQASRQLQAIENIEQTAMKLRTNSAELQRTLNDLSTRRESLQAEGERRDVERSITGLKQDLESAEKELLDLPRSNEKSQALRDLQRLRAAVNSQSTGVSVADLHRQDLEPRIRQVSQAAESLELLTSRLESSRDKLDDLLQRLNGLPTKTQDLTAEQRDRYSAIKRTRNAQGKLPQRVEQYRQLRAELSSQLATRANTTQQLSDNYSTQRQSAINNLQAIVSRDVETVRTNLQILASLRPGSVAWLLDSRNWEEGVMPSDLAIVLQRQPGKTPNERLQSAANEVAKLVGQVNGRIQSIQKQLDYPDQLAQATTAQAAAQIAQWQQLRDELADEGRLSDRQIQQLLKTPERIRAIDVARSGNQLIEDLAEFNQDFANLLLTDENVDPRQIIDQSELYRRARDGFAEETAQTKAAIAREIEDALAIATALQQRSERDRGAALIYEVDGRAVSVADLRSQLEQYNQQLREFLQIPQIDVAARVTAEEDDRLRRRQGEVDRAQAQIARLAALQSELSEVNLEIQKRIEARERGQKRGIAVDRLEARRRRILKDIENAGNPNG